eukprot:TRINITY_DN8795_c0_g1_i4.p1 TRINITY_DN8795_c0_g1~~TRINITY_DN8795_c0_g1_i4.p1  ORF type:complete len:738 (-),score=180.02 TRINITY_DN8795_c0_g1_i4:264-2477(-)
MQHFRQPVDESESDELTTLKARNCDNPANFSVNSAISPSKRVVDDKKEEEEKENTENGTKVVGMKKGGNSVNSGQILVNSTFDSTNHGGKLSKKRKRNDDSIGEGQDTKRMMEDGIKKISSPIKKANNLNTSTNENSIPQSSDSRFSCGKCQKKFSKKFILRRHRQLYHKERSLSPDNSDDETNPGEDKESIENQVIVNNADTNEEQIASANDLEHKSDDRSNNMDKNEKINDATNEKVIDVTNEKVEKVTNEKDDKVTNGKAVDEDESDGEDEVYEVETIRDYSYCKVSEEGYYFVKWLGWPEDQNTWEPIDNLQSCREKLVDFYNERVEARKTATGSEKRKLALPPDPRESGDLRDLFLAKYWRKPTQQTLEQLYQANKNEKKIKLQPEAQLWRDMETVVMSSKPNEKKIEQIVHQLNLKEMEKARRRQLTDLKEWEVKINSVEKDAYVSVDNDVDLEGPPSSMEYINAYKATEGIEIPDDPPLGCECQECKVISGGECCPGQAGVDFPYLANGRLRLSVGQPIYECNKRCACPPTCRNRVVQKGRTAKMSIFRTSNGRGWGVKALDKIKAGAFAVQYVGEVITTAEAERRGKDYDAAGRTYLFDLDFNLGDDNPYTVDAAYYGNLSHFINHSCDPNLSIFNVYINCLDPNLPQLCLFARRDIEKGEELTFDYCQSTQSFETDNSEASSPTKSSGSKTPSKSSLPPGTKQFTADLGTGTRTECRCGAKNCRQILF